MTKFLKQISPERKEIALEKILAASNLNFPLQPFDNLIIEFFQDISKNILSNKNINKIPAITALAFWLRKGNMQQIVKENQHLLLSDIFHICPQGIVFHICPANVDTIFFYSLSLSLLTGNKNILRVSERMTHEHIEFLFDIINAHLKKKEFEVIQNYLCIAAYGHDDIINSYFSKIADVRIIWGGDATINYFKSLNANPRIKDLVFADRVSFTVIDCIIFLNLSDDEKKEIVRKFFNDSYTFDQKGCSCPQAIFAIGNSETYSGFEKEFSTLLNTITSNNYQNDISSLTSLKFNQLTSDAIDGKIINYNAISFKTVFADTSSQNFDLHSIGGGYFYLQKIENINEIEPFITNKIQTLSYFGLDKNDINIIIEMSAGKGIDRIVPIGKSLDFHYIWDGYNMIEELCSKKFIG